ncbi:MAG: DUF3237 family protein [Erysipelotrichaceae bacterium]|nr:DUF3237 family protein [Erysipelotrichaceae bacterium]
MNREPVIEVKVEFDQPGMKFETETGEVSMIPFYGTVKGKLFNGIVEPWGVDTQVKNQIGIRHMSARYMLTGIDSAGEKCHIYIENNGWLTDDRPSRTFRTVPTFMTDSKTLAPYLHRNQFEGQGSVEEDGLWIRFYEIEH